MKLFYFTLILFATSCGIHHSFDTIMVEPIIVEPVQHLVNMSNAEKFLDTYCEDKYRNQPQKIARCKGEQLDVFVGALNAAQSTE